MTGTAKRLLAHDPALVTESQLSGIVVELARLGGWKRYHTFDSRRSNHGFPDWVFVKGSRLLFVELKSEAGKVRDEQREWLDALGEVAEATARVPSLIVAHPAVTLPSVEVYIWKPSDFDEIAETLTGRPVRKDAAA